MQENSGFAPAALYLSVATAAAGECILSAGALTSARATILWGFWQALALVLLCVFAAVSLTGRGAASGLARAALTLWLAWELWQTVWQAQTLCRQQFASAAVLGVAPFLILLGFKRTPEQLNYTARILWWFALCGVLVCAVGLGGQMRWQRLAYSSADTLPPVTLFAEYFAFPLLCPRRAHELRCAAWLPMGVYIVQAGFCAGLELLFGKVPEGYVGAELLRALSIGAFSRLDSFLLFIWLLLALFRVCVLCAAMRALWQQSSALCRCAEDKVC